ncbi:aspartate kinase [Flavobacteriaceae bacterium UJ101]|nr:aspartate kinase [Flavobacteriaceae bacterium UJ101]
MRIYKFGGASIKDAESIRNVVSVLEKTGFEKTFVVISAIGKTTNALEKVVKTYFNHENFEKAIVFVEENHRSILSDLFDSNDIIFNEVTKLFEDLRSFLKRNKSPNYNFIYDQVVSYGEMLSTKIVSAYLNKQGLQNKWLDVRDYIKTDTTYRDAQVDWDLTKSKIKTLDQNLFYITQGFVGSDENYFTTTLGREGSDYSASIFAYCLNAESVTIWKDVQGVLNADPRYFDKTTLLHHISYEEAIELAYYGASVIHPKTLQPLQNKEIPLYVKSYENLMLEGTSVKKGQPLEPKIACFIVKKKQVLLSISTLNFSFIVEENISEIFNFVANHGLKVNMIQNSAISFSLCMDDKFSRIDQLIKDLKIKYAIELVEDVSLYTIRHYNSKAIEEITSRYEVLVSQKMKETAQLVVVE